MSTLRPIQSYKNIVVNGPVSQSAATNISDVFILGKDLQNISGGVNEVPTGNKVDSIDVQCSFTNLVSVSANLVFSIQSIHSGQSVITPNGQSGSPQRNQVYYTRNLFLGKDQNSNFHFRFKIPKKYGRIREGDQWILVFRCDTVFASVTQMIYKHYG